MKMQLECDLTVDDVVAFVKKAELSPLDQVAMLRGIMERLSQGSIRAVSAFLEDRPYEQQTSMTRSEIAFLNIMAAAMRQWQEFKAKDARTYRGAYEPQTQEPTG